MRKSPVCTLQRKQARGPPRGALRRCHMGCPPHAAACVRMMRGWRLKNSGGGESEGERRRGVSEPRRLM